MYSHPRLTLTSTSSVTLVLPRLTECALGKISLTSFINCLRRDDGSREVVIQTFGSLEPAKAYSSSICDFCTCKQKEAYATHQYAMRLWIHLHHPISHPCRLSSPSTRLALLAFTYRCSSIFQFDFMPQ